jgi:hypothetical protein
MSRALRITIDEIPSVSLTRKTWHPFYASMNADHIPCLAEYMDMMYCVQEYDITSCAQKYKTFVDCVRNHGIDMK